MRVLRIDNLEDDRLAVYRDVRNKALPRQSGLFVAEGWRVVDRLLDSGIPVESVLISERRIDALGPLFAERATVFALAQAEAEKLVGYNFHCGVMACARRPENRSLESLTGNPGLILCCPQMTSPDNLGSLARLAAGFGAAGLLLGESSSDPWLRRVVRVSMGTIFELPIRVSPDLLRDLLVLREQNYCLLGAELTETSRPLECFGDDGWRLDMVLLLGNEAEGMPPEFLDMLDATYHIEMTNQVDSINVTHAAAVFLYEMTRKDKK
ncbi:TrmH family RNA methyltransferase [Rubinisphaera margarita]|uniref:TrmH family RNA methyltransferase n=1 Tax=Rubinisphaera margarita TaxID=2909586 RepID=UPI001EE89581|nr:RNA methyltransferase [Rubinisphaera margarita]MCG6157931.1 RNA methyltransferase [Rubinisphaera margarita]